jgi:hypothetical protein
VGTGFGAGFGRGGVVATGWGLATGFVWVAGEVCAGGWGRVGVAVVRGWPAVDLSSIELPPVPA